MILAGAITGAAGGLIMWLLWRLLRYTLPQLPAPTSETVSGILGVTVGAAEPLTIIMGNVVLGLVVGATLMLLFDRRLDQPVDAEQAQRQRRQQVLIIGLETGVITTLFVLIFSEPLLALAWGVAEGFMYAASARYIFGWTYQTEVRTVEALGWSWPHAATGALVGLALAAVAEVIESLLYGYNGAARTVVTLVVAGFVMGGLRGRSAESKNRPNQGVWLSLRNAFIAALVLSVTMAALSPPATPSSGTLCPGGCLGGRHEVGAVPLGVERGGGTGDAASDGPIGDVSHTGTSWHLPNCAVAYPLSRSVSGSGAQSCGRTDDWPGALVANSVMAPMPTVWWLRPVSRAARVGAHNAVVWNRV